MDYQDAGVHIEEGYRAVEKYRELARLAWSPSAIGGIGAFAGLFSLKTVPQAGEGMEEPVLLAGADGVGTKLDIAFRLKKYDTVGIDCVAMCANDLLCHGARPLFFLDYLACSSLDAAIAAELVKGAALGCRESGMALLGGETAEMPGFYKEGVYDMAGFAVGIAERKNLIDGSAVHAGDVLVGLAASGVHSNGFSLIRKAIPDLQEDFGGMPIGYALLEPTRLYVKPLLGLLEEVPIRGAAHITGGGFYENIPRMFPQLPQGGAAFDAVIAGPAPWPIPPIFARIAAGMADGKADSMADSMADSWTSGAKAQRAGAALLQEDRELRRAMFNTFNMGIGFVLALAPEDCGRAVAYLEAHEVPAWPIGRVEAVRGKRGAVYFEDPAG
ncbi:MAG: phosphoribosylformylglycinamidine cyclo-ligase [Treponema sp.]|jgi:phosphoribosylformylglycinamidine cyclo-ligase|nr:phosphoribosylformylglycinamidine cyclo-ligase [Treponema sp.]